MSNIQNIWVAGIIYGVACLSQPKASEDTQQEMLRDLTRIHSVFYSLYAPKLWKKEYAKWDLSVQIQAAKDKVIANPNITVKEYHKIMYDFFNSTQDFHVGMVLHSTESAALPFQVKGANGRYFLVYIDRSKLAKDFFPFQEGDEVISWGDLRVGQVVDSIQEQIGKKNNSNPTYRELAESLLTKRMGNLGMKVPKGAITIGIRPKSSTQVYTRQLKWDYRPELIDYSKLANAFSPGFKIPAMTAWMGDEPVGRSKYDSLMVAAHWVEQPDSAPLLPNKLENYYLLGAKKSFIPDLGVKTWEAPASNSFYAYTFLLPGNKKTIGYIRIPHYRGSIFNTNDFAQIIKEFETRAEALVIDQVNNPGGSVFYLYSLLSMLSDQAMRTPRHRMSITPGDVKQAHQELKILENITGVEEAKKIIGPTINGYPVSYDVVNFMRDYYQFTIDQWNAGKRLSEPYHLFGVDYINPYPDIQFTKPILLLVNSLVFSGGDFFAAILQDNKRATLLGTRTAGAGGYVRTEKVSNAMGLDLFTVTGSIAERDNQQPIEDLGVKPNVEYAFTAEDFMQNYKNYLGVVHRELRKLVP